MIRTVPAMKLVSILSRVTAVAAVASAIAFLSNWHAGAVYAAATSAFLLLIFARDYSPRARRWTPRVAPAHRTPPARSRQRFGLAA